MFVNQGIGIMNRFLKICIIISVLLNIIFCAFLMSRYYCIKPLITKEEQNMVDEINERAGSLQTIAWQEACMREKCKQICIYTKKKEMQV